MNSKDNIMQVENPQLVGREQLAVYVPVNDILNGMADDPGGRFKGDTGDEGPEGVGISSISAGTNDNIVIRLSNGKTHSVDIPFIKGSTGPQGEKGDKGDPFFVSIIYNSVQEMEDGAATDSIPDGAFALIDTGNVDDEDNAKLFVKKNSVYSYLTDMSGSAGIQGPAGVSITSVTIDSNSHLKVTLSNGTVLDAGKIETGGGGTKITVGGIEVSEWNADTKLDKITSTNGYVRAYTVNTQGIQTSTIISSKPYQGHIVQREVNGQIRVPETPVQNYDAASKKYVDDKFKGGSNASPIPRLQEITYSVTVDTTATVPTLSFPHSTFRPTALYNIYPFIIGKLIFFIDDTYLISIDAPFGAAMYEATVYVNDPLAPQTGTVVITEDGEGTSFKMTDEEGTFVQDMIDILQNDEMHYVQIFVQY